VPLATETGLLDALNARLPPALEPLASWTRTGKVELRAGDVGSQHWWSSRVTQAKAASLLKAATGRDVPRFQAEWAGKAGGWLSPPPGGGPGRLPHRGKLFHAAKAATGGALATSRFCGQTSAVCGGPADVFGDHAV